MKKFITAISAIALALSIVGCTKDEAPKDVALSEPAVTDTEKSTDKETEEVKQTEGPSTKELNILTWENYVPNEVIKQFSDETGIKVNYSSANDNESMFAKLQAAKGGEYDIIICSDYTVKAMIENEGLVKELDKSKLPNYSNIDTSYLGQYYDLEDKYTIPYAPSSAILVYDSSAIDFDITSYADLWRSELENSIVLLNGDRDVIGFTLQMLGYSLNSTDPAELEEAKAKLLELKPNIIAFDANEPHNKIISGEASVGYMFGSQATAAMEGNENIKFAFPEEGLGRYTDCAVMAQNAPNEENAYTFLNYILDGKNSAAISNINNYPNCVTAAKEFLSEEYLANETINIPNDVLEKTESYEDIGEAQKLYSDIWVALINQ